MSRLQAGALEMTAEPVDLEEVLPAALHRIGVPDGSVRLDVPEGLPRVLADRGLLERALASVLSNSIRRGGRARGAAERCVFGGSIGIWDG